MATEIETTAGQPWENPQVGDVLIMRDGKPRSLFEVYHEHGGWVGFTVQTKFGNGRPAVRRGSIKGWSNTARVEVAKGGRYERPPDPVVPLVVSK